MGPLWVCLWIAVLLSAGSVHIAHAAQRGLAAGDRDAEAVAVQVLDLAGAGQGDALGAPVVATDELPGTRLIRVFTVDNIAGRRTVLRRRTDRRGRRNRRL